MNLIDTRICKSSGYEVYRRNDRNNKEIKIHTVIAERILGRPLKGREQVHHVNEIRHDNTPSNLVICPDNDYHKLLHQRTDALKACGHANWLKCSYCKQYDDPKNMYQYPGKRRGVHRECINKYHREYRQEKPEMVRQYHRDYRRKHGK